MYYYALCYDASIGRWQVSESDFFWDELLQLVEDGWVVPILGPGLLVVRHHGREVLLYRLLAERLADQLSVPADDLPSGDELNEVACRYLAKYKKWQRIYSALKTVMPRDEELTVPEPLLQLADILPLKLFVSGSFDSLLERALRQVRSGSQGSPDVLAYSPGRTQDLQTELERLERPTVFHLFGRLSATPTYAVTQEDILEFMHALQSGEQRPELLFDELHRKSLLILGSGFSGWLARFFLRTTKNHPLRSLQETTDYLADDKARQDNSLVLFLRHFSSGTEVYQEGGAIEFVDELHRRWNERRSSRGDAAITAATPKADGSPPGAAKPGTVFISYASEDLEAALALRSALAAKGIDVFLDKRELRAGDDYEAKLRRVIGVCSLFIPIISKHTLTGRRRYFRREWRLALDEALEVVPSQRFIIPVVLDDTSPEDEAIPGRFRGLHWEHAPEGNASPDFIDMVRGEYQSYLSSLERAS